MPDDITNTIQQSIKQANQKGSECHIYIGIPNILEINQTNDLPSILIDNVEKVLPFADKDILIIASKIISKAEGNTANLANITPTKEAIDLAQKSGKRAEVCQVILNESISHFVENGTIIAWHKQGFQLTSAGVDKLDGEYVATIPNDSDKSARDIMECIKEQTGKDVAVIIIDSEGRADRGGAGSVALGVAGIQPLRVSTYASPDGSIKQNEETLSDLLAGGASVIMGQRGKGVPVVLVRGLEFEFDKEAQMKSIIHKV